VNKQNSIPTEISLPNNNEKELDINLEDVEVMFCRGKKVL
jgi:hypothetical protein